MAINLFIDELEDSVIFFKRVQRTAANIIPPEQLVFENRIAVSGIGGHGGKLHGNAVVFGMGELLRKFCVHSQSLDNFF